MSLHNLETVLLLIPDSPIACIRSSTRRVETPPTHASWITATSAFSEVFLGSRKGGKVTTLPQLGDPQLHGSQARVQAPIPIAIAVRGPLAGALMTSGADHAFHIGLHQHLNDRLGHGAQEIAISGFGQQLGKR